VRDDQKLAGDYVDFTYFYADVQLGAGTQSLALTNTDTNAVIVDAVNLMPGADIPPDFTNLTTDKIAITPTVQPLIYDLRME
jgi:hypothetical protein